ncbi:oxidoreductase [Xanthobacter versatilis]|uniref:oxidoreductase n=1 Tax=Xanthobacter autotrophicus (strain ATCC BAA-1158 / Py2) TaxID=78245 RepID=UPI003727776D
MNDTALPDNTIPPPIAHTAAAMDEAISARARSGDSAGVPMSAATHVCDRSIWYVFRWCAPPETASGPRERRFRTGLQYERWLLDDLRLTGAEVQEIDDATGKQVAVQLADGHLRGKVDGVATGIVEAPKTAHVVECKSMKAADWRGVVKHGVQKHKPDHWVQMQLYMQGLGLTRALYICANKDTDEIHTERVEFDAVASLGMEARVLRIVGSPLPPAKASDDPTSFTCRFCRANEICHSGAWARFNCRTCLHSEPVPAAAWRCLKHERGLSYADMQAGCGDHRFIPDLVPGEQVDVRDGELIVYRLRTGAEWVDGAREAAE